MNKVLVAVFDSEDKARTALEDTTALDERIAAIGGVAFRQPVEDVMDGQYETAAGSIRRRPARSTLESQAR